MGIAKSVELLASTIVESRPLNERQRQAADMLGAMPVYMNERHLESWERAVQECWPVDDEHSEENRLLWSVFELGRSNLYRLFDPQASAEALVEVENVFSRAGVTLPFGIDVSAW
jgi:hypothetical protein